MDLYLVSLATGAIGLAAMAVGGLSHGGHGAARGGHGHTGSGHGGHGHGGHGPGAAHGGHATHSAGGREQGVGISLHTPAPGWHWSSLFSPRLLFSVLVGFGAGGIAATPLGEPFRFGAAILAAVAFETLAVGPLWRFLFRFESRPASTLESAIEDEAQAVTGFDANGNGLVAVEVDGQLIQLLATLSPEERARGLRIRSGDKVRVAEVDAARGRCTVTAPTR